MMKFEVVDYFGVSKMSTEYVECIPWHQIESMSQAGYKFKVNSKSVSKNSIQSAVESAVGHPIEIPVYERPIFKPDNTPLAADVEPSLPQVAPKTMSKEVRCINNGKVYKNQSAAAKDLGIDPAQVSDSIKTGRPRSGYTFERVEA